MDDSDSFPLSPCEVLNRIVDISVLLHLEQGDRLELQCERAQLMEHGRRIGIIPPREVSD
jgi:hypothetical protein